MTVQPLRKRRAQDRQFVTLSEIRVFGAKSRDAFLISAFRSAICRGLLVLN